MITPDNVKAIGTGILVERIYGQEGVESTTPGGLLLPAKDEFDDDAFIVGKVVSVGGKVTEITVGNVLLIRSHLALKLPYDPLSKPKYYKVEERADMVTAILPSAA